MSEVKYDPTFKNSAENKEIFEELGMKDFSNMTDQELEELYKSKEQELYIANDVNGAYTSEDRRTGISKELMNIQREIKRREESKINDTPQDGGDYNN